MPLVRAGGRTFDVDAVAFDKDGTLIDLDATWAPVAAAWVRGVSLGDIELARTVGAHLGLDLDRSSLVTDSTFAAGTLDQIRAETIAALTAHGLDVAELDVALRTGVEHVVAVGPSEPRPLVDLPLLFGALAAGGVRCAIVTADDRSSADRIVAELGIADLTSVVVGGDETERPKPAPDALLAAAERLGLAVERLLMVGDSLTDQGAARAAGCAFVAVGPGSAAAVDSDAVIDDVGQITLAHA